MPDLNVLGICGSLREGSWNRKLLHAAIANAPEGMRITEYTGLADIPPYNQDHDGPQSPQVVLSLRQQIAESDGILFVSPEYNYGIPNTPFLSVATFARPRPQEQERRPR